MKKILINRNYEIDTRVLQHVKMVRWVSVPVFVCFNLGSSVFKTRFFWGIIWNEIW